MPRDASETDEILVGKIRKDISDPSGRSLCLFSGGEQLLKGAALNVEQNSNSVQFARVIVRSLTMPELQREVGVDPKVLDSYVGRYQVPTKKRL